MGDYNQYLARLDSMQLKKNASLSQPSSIMNIIMRNKNKLEKQCPCIGLPNSPSANFTTAELALEKELKLKEAIIQKKKKTNRNSSGNNSQITKLTTCAANARNAKGGTLNYTQYLAWLDKTQLKKNEELNAAAAQGNQ